MTDREIEIKREKILRDAEEKKMGIKRNYYKKVNKLLREEEVIKSWFNYLGIKY